MILINDVRFDVSEESDLFKRFTVFRLTMTSTGKSIIMASDGTVLGKLKRWLSERPTIARYKRNGTLAKAIADSPVIRLDILWQDNDDVVEECSDDEIRRKMRLYDRMYDLVWSERTYKPYGYNDLSFRYHEGGQLATGAVMRLRAEHDLHRVTTSDGDAAFVEVDGNTRKKPASCYSVLQFDINYNFIREWSGLKAIAEQYGFSIHTLRKKASQKYKTSAGEIDNIMGGYRWFSSYKADWFERETGDDGSWRYVGRYDLSQYYDGNRKAFTAKNGRRRKGELRVRRTRTEYLVNGDKEALIIMGGITNG